MEEVVDFDTKSELANTPEGKLMISILTQAVEDALYVPPKLKRNLTEGSSRSQTSKNNISYKTKVEAIRWLFDDNDVYTLCCEIVGIHKDKIRQLIIDKVGAKIIHPLVYGFYQPDGY